VYRHCGEYRYSCTVQALREEEVEMYCIGNEGSGVIAVLYMHLGV